MAIDGGSVEVRFEGDVAPLRRSVEEAVEEVSKLQVAAEKVDEALGSDFGTNALKSFDKFSSSAGDSFDAFVDKADQSVLAVRNLGSALKSLSFTTLTAGATAAVGALTNLVRKGIQATDFLETSRVAMSGLTGSIEEGNKAMSLAANFWQNNPFQRIDVTNATKQLVQFGRTTSQISGDLEILGNVSLSTGMDIDQLARYYARVSASGRAMTMDLEMMSDRGVPIYRELSKALGTTTAGVRELASQGKIDFETFKKAMEGAVSAEAMEAYENTLARQTDRLKGSIQILAGELAGYKIINNELVISEEGLEKAWTRLIKTLATNLRSDSMKKGLEGIGNALAKVVDKITTLVEPAFNALGKALQFIGDNSELLLPILGALAVAIGRLGSSIPVVSSIIAQLGGGRLGGIVETIKTFIRLNPLLAATIGILAIGFADAMKNSEEFRATFGSIVQSLATIAKNLWEAFKGVFDVITQIIQSLAGSGAIQGILQGVASALAWIAQAIASIPPEMLATLISFFVSLKLLKANPLYLLAAGLALLIGKIKELGGIGKVLEKLPETLGTIGHNMMTGLINGIQEGAKKVFDYIRQVGASIVTSLKNVLGIHSPSTVMYGIGEDIVLGLANGIEDSNSVVQVAMNNLAKDILALSEKVIKNQVDFGILDVKGEYQQWKKVSRLFTKGSEQYNYALEKMEDARKQANLQILGLQQAYNNALDETISKIANMYGLLDDVNLKAGKNAQQILKGLDQQVAKMTEWAEAQKIIAESGLDAKLIEELQAMGVDSTSELSAIANMTADELASLNEMWLKKQSIANDAGVKQMEGLKKDTLQQINELKDGIDGATVDVEDIGGRLVSSISDGVTGALPTLGNAFDQLGSYIEKAQKELSKSVGGASSKGVGGVGGVETDVPNAGDEVAKSLKEEIENGLGKVKDMLPNILLGAVAAWGGLKLGKKVLNAIASKLIGGSSLAGQGFGGLIQEKLAGTLNKKQISTWLGQIDYKRDGGFMSKAIGTLQKKLEGESNQMAQTTSKTAKNMTKVARPAESIAQSSTSIGTSMQTAGKGLSKVNSVLNTIIKGSVAIIAIAAAIAAMAGALWLAYNALKDTDFGKFQLVLLEMIEAIAVFGVAATVIGKVPVVSLAVGLVAIAGIAADIALVALACKSAYEMMKDIDFEKYQLVILEMLEALAVFGGFAALLGLLGWAAAGGILVIAGIALDVALVAKACRSAYESMKDIDFDKYQFVILEMIEALGAMGGFSAILGLLTPLIGLGWFSIIAICDELVRISNALSKVYRTVPDDIVGVNRKIDLIKQVLNKIIDTDLGSLIGAIVSAVEAGPLERTMDMYVHVAEQLNKLQKLNLDSGKISANLDKVKSALDQVKSKTDVISATLQAWADDANARSVESAGRVITVYGEVIDTLEKLSDVNIKSSVKDGVEKMTAFIQSVLDTISSITSSWWVDVGAIERTVGLTQSILNKFSEIIPVIKEKIQGAGLNENDAKKQIKAISAILYEIGQINEVGGIENKEKIVGYTQSILNKFTELVPVIKQIIDLGGVNVSEATDRIHDVQTLLYEIGKINERGGIENKEKIVGYTQSILNKFTELVPTMKQLVGMELNAKNALKTIQNVRHLVYEIGQINESDAGSLTTKEWIVGMASSIAWKLSEFTNALSNIGNTDGSVATNAINAMNTMFNGIANNMSNNVQVFNNVGINMGQAFANGVRSQTANAQQAGLQLQASLWSAIEGKMGDEYQQGVWMATQFGNGLKSVNFNGVGQAIQSSLWWGIQNRMQDEYYQGRSMGERFRQGLYDVDYGNAGWWAVQGFINGAWGKAGSGDGVYNTGWWIADRFLRGLKDRGGQGSPWKTTIESGNWAIEGFIDGMKEQESALVNEANTLADQVIDALTMDDLTMSPTLDVSGRLAPSMGEGEYSVVGGSNGGVMVQQTNNNYTEYDVEQVQRDLAYALSKV